MDETPNKDYIRELAEKWISGTISEEEKTYFENWYGSFNDEEVRLPSGKYTDEESLRKAILYRIYKKTGKATPRVRLFYRIAAAASVIILLTISGYFFFREKNSSPPLVDQQQFHDIAPGGNKAILTLSNGSKVVLDSMHKGQLISQGNSKIIKVNNGLLAYHTKAPCTKSPKIAYNTLTVPSGGQFRLVLPDGTKVWLNATSSIRFPTAFTGKKRVVEITGEAYFEVASDVGMPFKVKTGSTEISVLGTHFNVDAYKNESAIKVTLLEGSVRVSQLITHHSQVIKPGEQAQVNKRGEIALIKPADVTQAIAWKEGLFEFDGSIQEIMREIARWYNVEVVYQGGVTDKAFGGTISRYKKVSKVLNMLALTGSIHFKVEENAEEGYKGKIIVKP